MLPENLFSFDFDEFATSNGLISLKSSITLPNNVPSKYWSSPVDVRISAYFSANLATVSASVKPGKPVVSTLTVLYVKPAAFKS